MMGKTWGIIIGWGSVGEPTPLLGQAQAKNPAGDRPSIENNFGTLTLMSPGLM